MCSALTLRAMSFLEWIEVPACCLEIGPIANARCVEVKSSLSRFKTLDHQFNREGVGLLDQLH